MGKGSAIFGHKSGTLPEVRQIFKKPIKKVIVPPNPNAGYAEGVQHPRGSSRTQPLPKVHSVSKLIEETVKVPKDIPDLAKLTQSQKEKATKATLRREYYIQSLKNEQTRLETKENREKYLAEKEAKRKAEEVHEISEATRLTLPTIDSLLEGPFMRQRTEEETQILQAKRKANRLNNELIGKTNRAVGLLELFYESKNFITNETDLAKAIETAFTKGDHNQIESYNPDGNSRSHNPILQDSLFGTINSKPGLVEVEEQLSGDSSAFDQLVSDALTEKGHQDLERVKNQTKQ